MGRISNSIFSFKERLTDCANIQDKRFGIQLLGDLNRKRDKIGDRFDEIASP